MSDEPFLLQFSLVVLCYEVHSPREPPPLPSSCPPLSKPAMSLGRGGSYPVQTEDAHSVLEGKERDWGRERSSSERPADSRSVRHDIVSYCTVWCKV